MIFRRNETPTPAPMATTPPAPSKPAISLEKIQRSAPALVSLYKQAGVSLQKHGVAGERAAVYLVLDRSGSMAGYYQVRRGQISHMQYFAEQALGLSANLDDDGIVPTIFFDHQAYPVVEIGLDDYQGRIGIEHDRLGSMGGTDYASAMIAVLNHYRRTPMTAPAFVIFQTDGRTGNESAVADLLKQYSSYPIFWQFVGFGHPGSREFDFLRRLDKLRGRQVDNAGFFEAGSDPLQLSDADVYDRLMGEYPAWLTAARAKGIVR